MFKSFENSHVRISTSMFFHSKNIPLKLDKKNFKIPIIHHNSNIAKLFSFHIHILETSHSLMKMGIKVWNLNEWWRCENQKSRKCENEKKMVLDLWGEAIEKRWRKHINENVCLFSNKTGTKFERCFRSTLFDWKTHT
jgi:hypothetical protein